MDKHLLLQEIIKSLETLHESAVKAATQAHDTATHEENVAENKYDTLGLEAAYLAHGQNKRVAECEADLAAYRALKAITFTDDTPVAIGALVELIDANDASQTLFLGPGAGGLKLPYRTLELTLITPSAPLGAALLKRFAGDEIKINVAGIDKIFEIVTVS